MSKKSRNKRGDDSAPEQPSGKKADKAAQAKEKIGPWRRRRENAEAVLVAIILALIIRHFSVEAFEIPTGSMAPALNGVHIQTTCPNCDTAADVGIHTLASGHVNNRIDQQSQLLDLFLYEGDCPECGCHVEGRTPKKSGQVFCPNCRVQRPTRPDGYSSSRLRLGEVSVTCRECTFSYVEVYEVNAGRLQVGSDTQGGHKILVNKFLYRVREPRRWEVIVFHYNRQRNYIKRLIGLPGETLEIRDGDIWINGKIERKPQWAQEQLWYPLHDSAVKERGYVATPPWGLEKGWQRTETGSFAFNGLQGRTAMTYQRGIKNRLPYSSRPPGGQAAHSREDDGFQTVYDVRVLTDVTINGGSGSLQLEIVNDRTTFVCSLPAGPLGSTIAPGVLEVQGADGAERTHLAEFGPVLLEQKRTYAIDFAIADRQLTVRIDGETLTEFPLPETWMQKPAEGQLSTVRVVADRIGGIASRVQLFRDNYYADLPPHGQGQGVRGRPAVLRDDEYFALGDNSNNSQDSRYWGPLSRDNLLGRAFIVFWPALPWHWELGFIR